MINCVLGLIILQAQGAEWGVVNTSKGASVVGQHAHLLGALDSIRFGERIRIGKGGSLTVVQYKGMRQYAMVGPSELIAVRSGLQLIHGAPVKRLRDLGGRLLKPDGPTSVAGSVAGVVARGGGTANINQPRGLQLSKKTTVTWTMGTRVIGFTLILKGPKEFTQELPKEARSFDVPDDLPPGSYLGILECRETEDFSDPVSWHFTVPDAAVRDEALETVKQALADSVSPRLIGLALQKRGFLEEAVRYYEKDPEYQTDASLKEKVEYLKKELRG